MNNPAVFYAVIVGAAALLAIGWLFSMDLRQGKKFRFDSLDNRQKPVLTTKTAWIRFGPRIALMILMFVSGIFWRQPVLVCLALLSITINVVLLIKILRSVDAPRVVK